MKSLARQLVPLIYTTIVLAISSVRPLPRNDGLSTVFNPAIGKEVDANLPGFSKNYTMLYNKMGFWIGVNRHNVLQGYSLSDCMKDKLRCLFQIEVYTTKNWQVRNLKTSKYIGIDRKGKVFTTSFKSRETLLYVRHINDFTAFSSTVYHSGRNGRTIPKKAKTFYWTLGLKRLSGATKTAYKTSFRHKSGQFLVVHIADSSI